MTITAPDKISLSLFAIVILIIGTMIYAYVSGQFERHKSWVHSVDNNNEDVVVSASDNELLVWNKRKCTHRLTGHTNVIKTVIFSHSGKQLASGSIDKSIKIWSLQNKEIIKTLSGHNEGVNKVEFNSTDEYIISAGYDNVLLIWDWMNNKVVKRISVKHTNFSVNNQDILAYTDSSCNLVLFDLKSMCVIKVVGKYCGWPVFSPKNNIIAISDTQDNTFSFIDIKSNNVLSTIAITKYASSCEVSTFKFTPDGKYLVAGMCGGDITIWDWRKKLLNRTLHGHTLHSVNSLTFNNKNQLISGSTDRSLKFWNWRTGELKMIVGDGLFQLQLNKLLSIFVVLTLMAGFWALIQNIKNKYSSYIVLAILSCWTLGIGLIAYNFRFTLHTYAIPVIWITTALSGLFFISIWFSWLAIFTVPISLLFCYIKMITDHYKGNIYFPLLLNFAFAGILTSLATSTGLL